MMTGNQISNMFNCELAKAFGIEGLGTEEREIFLLAFKVGCFITHYVDHNGVVRLGSETSPAYMEQCAELLKTLDNAEMRYYCKKIQELNKTSV